MEALLDLLTSEMNPYGFFQYCVGEVVAFSGETHFLFVLQHLNILQSGLSSLPQPLHSLVM